MPHQCSPDTRRGTPAGTAIRGSLPGGAFDQPFAETTLPPERPFYPRHPARIVLVIISKEVQQPVERENPKLGSLRMPRLTGLASGDATGDHDVAEVRIPLQRPNPGVDSVGRAWK